MKRTKLILLLMAATLLIGACDPAQRIVMRNKSDQTVYVSWIMEEDSVSNNKATQILKTSTYTLGTQKNDKEETLYFGIGVWSDQAIDRFVDKVTSIEIVGVSTRVKMTDKEAIKKHFKANRGGFMNSKLTVKVY